MTSEREFLELAAECFGVTADSLSLETTYASIPSWDSMAHLQLVMEIAARHGVEIPFADVTRVRSLWEFFRRLNGLSPKKVVAVDLDGTLWDGVVGEDGPDGIRPNVAFLKSLKSLKSRGVLVVALSKNNEKDGLSGLARLEGLGGVTKDDFVTWRIDWNEKAENLKSVAAELNLGTEAFVFVDDSPAERLKMTKLLPDVTVASFPPNLEAFFPERELTAEDRRKTEEYKAEARRRRHLESLGRLEIPEVWEALACWIDVHELTEGEVARVAQLSQKANQFDVCTNRYSEADVRRVATEGIVVTCHAGDAFGTQGLVAFAVIRRELPDRARVLDWVMSCRAAGRGLEQRFEAETEKILRGLNVGELSAAWRDSGKNAPVRELFDGLGFELIGQSEGERRYCKRLERSGEELD